MCACSHALEMLLCLLTLQQHKTRRPLLSAVCPAELLQAPALWGPPLTPQHFDTLSTANRMQERRTQKGEPGLRFKAKPDAKGKVCACVSACVSLMATVGLKLLRRHKITERERA